MCELESKQPDCQGKHLQPGKVVYSDDSATAQSKIKDDPKGIALNGHIERTKHPLPNNLFRFDSVFTFQLWIRPNLR